MKKLIKIISVMLASIMLMTACGSKLSSDAVVSINGVEVSKEYFDKTVAKVARDNDFETVFGEQIWDMEIEPGVTFSQHFSQQMLDMIITHEMVMQKLENDAEGKKLIASDEEVNSEYAAYMDIVSKDPEYSEFLTSHGVDEAFIKDHLRKNLTYRNFATSTADSVEVTDEEVKEFYDANIDQYTHNEVKASHILISTLDEKDEPLPEEQQAKKLELAQEVLLKAQGGADFASLAKEYSDDTVSAVEGGDLGFFGQGVMVPEFNDKVFSMEIGEISDLVETQFGYHIIYLTDKLNEVEALEDVKNIIVEQIRNDKFEEKMKELSDKTKVVINKELVDVNI